eukprot:14221-Heterococcus_DN1.PRE.2
MCTALYRGVIEPKLLYAMPTPYMQNMYSERAALTCAIYHVLQSTPRTCVWCHTKMFSKTALRFGNSSMAVTINGND